MIRLKLDADLEPAWLTLATIDDVDVAVKVKRPTPAVRMAAGQLLAARLRDDMSEAERLVAAVNAYAEVAIEDWRGVGDENGEPIAVSPAAIAALLDVWPLYQAFEQRYVLPVFAREAEKNASAPLPNGAGAGATTTVQRRAARKGRARSAPSS
jgi:hypothetical protein